MTPDAIVMVRPRHFGYNAETAASNSFQLKPERSGYSAKALKEFDAMVQQLREAGVRVWVHPDPENEECTDAVFPNNWLVVMPSGEVVLFPMMAPSRRKEVNHQLVSALCKEYSLGPVTDLTHWADEGVFLEGTGSIVFDHAHRMAYACESPRTNLKLLNEFCAERGYKNLSFRATDIQGQAIYHTNVVMGVGEKTAILCTESIEDTIERSMLCEKLRQTGKSLVEISFSQMGSFAGNAFFVRTVKGGRWIMSQSAFDALRDDQLATLRLDGEIVDVSIPVIETLGGGSARCMVAGVFSNLNKE